MYHGLGAFGIGVYAIGGRGASGALTADVERFLASGDCWTSSDIDGDADVDLSDLAELLARYGESCP